MSQPLVPHQIHPVKPARHITVVGGDGRMTYVAERLLNAGCSVTLYACGSEGLPVVMSTAELRVATSLEKAADGADALVLPLPVTRDGETVWCPRDPAAYVPLETVSTLMERHPSLLVCGGRLPACMTESYASCADGFFRAVDYYDDEALQLRNAYLTAEAAVMIAMRESDCALRGSTVGIIGYGRIARLLAHLLLLLGAEVTVSVRREEARLMAEIDGCHAIPLGASDRAGGGMYPLCCGHTVIFNTVPAPILNRDLLCRLEHGTILIDLASAPFGVRDEDVREATAHGTLRYLRLPSLPGSYAPRDAGYIIAATVLNILRRIPTVVQGGDTL